LEQKAEEAIERHKAEASGRPFFLYMAAQLVHQDYAAPDSFVKRCGGRSKEEGDGDETTYCAMNLMLDEVKLSFLPTRVPRSISHVLSSAGETISKTLLILPLYTPK